MIRQALVTHLQKVDSVVGSCLRELVLKSIVHAGQDKNILSPTAVTDVFVMTVLQHSLKPDRPEVGIVTMDAVTTALLSMAF